MAVSNKEETGKTTGKTQRGKELRIKKVGTFPYWEIYYYPGGQVPKALSGYFTSELEAKHAIDTYQKNK